MARLFNGTSDYATMADNAALTMTLPWTVGGWIHYPTSGRFIPRQILYWGTSAGPASGPLFVLDLEPESGGNTNKLFCVCRDADSDTVVLASTTAIGLVSGWQHVLVRGETGGTIRIYLNGVEDADNTNAAFGDINCDRVMDNGYYSPMLWGLYYCYWDGGMAEWAKWDVDLTTEQITALANGVRPPEVGTRPAWYVPMLGGLEEEIAGLAVTNNGTTVSEHPPKIVPAGQYI